MCVAMSGKRAFLLAIGKANKPHPERRDAASKLRWGIMTESAN
jgi:hypothetical protein